MDKLTHFANELLQNADKPDHFNSGSNKAEIACDRQHIADAAGMKGTHELIDMTSQDLEALMQERFKQETCDNFETTICGLIAGQALVYPDRVAVIDGELKINYKSLIKRANEVAGELERRSIKPGSLVAVCMNRSWELVAALLGVMQAGCAYIPLDPVYPQDRIEYMLSHSGATAAIADSEHTAVLCESVGELIWIKDVGAHASNSIKASINDLAYVIYTSGSTGRPKGVAIEHQGLVFLSKSMRELFTEEELQGVFAGASVCFDTSVMEIMGTLSLGGTVILAKNALELTALPASNQVTTVVMVASAMRALLATDKLPEGIRCLIFGGEALNKSLVEQVRAERPDLRILNAYGPTEDTVYSTIAEITQDTQVITIGKSISESRSYILNDQLQPADTGEAGELYLAGSKLARGYLHEAELTKERFIAVKPTGLITDSRLYKTGDLCRWTDDGEIEFLGRVDQQVKVRGYRIELGEIESALESMQGVDGAALVAVEGSLGQKILVAYIVSQDKTVTEESIKSYLSERLPKYMLPQRVKHLQALPYLPNDKLDRKKLMSFEADANVEQNSFKRSNHAVNDSSQLSASLVKLSSDQRTVTLSIIQREVASLINFSDPDQVLPNQSLDSLGLDSLTTLELSSRLTKIFGRRLPASIIQQHFTCNALVDYVMNTAENGADSSSANTQMPPLKDTLAGFQFNLQSSHPTFQAANASAWSADDKSKLLQEILQLVNDNRINPYGKVLQTGSSARGLVSDSYNDEEQEAIIWSTNLYFGLNRDPRVIKQATIALEQFGTGMGISAAATGMTNQHLAFEQEFAQLIGKPSACLFPTGYTANLGAVSGLVGKDDVVVIDQLCHASIVDGARLSGATIRTFQHNSASDLATVLESEMSPYRTVLVVLESVYSMGEGTAPVAEIVRTAKKYGALVLVDEAHSFGFYGENGAGVCAAQGVTEEVDFIMTTLSKALGSIGGVVAASQQHIDLLKASSRAYIFQASISPADIAAALTSLRCLRSDETLREQLWDMTRYMRQRFEEAGYDLGTGDGPIVTPHFGDKDKLYAIVRSLYKRGVQTLAVTYPIVEIGRGRLRFICSAAHTREDVDKTLQALIEAEREVDAQIAQKANTVKHTNLSLSELEDWSNAFVAYLKQVLAAKDNNKVTVPTPNLAISIGVAEQSEHTTILVKDGDAALSAHKPGNLPSCSLLLTEQAAVTALQTSNIQGLLQSILNGACVLNGQVEPFIWLIGRMVDQLQAAHMAAERETLAYTN